MSYNLSRLGEHLSSTGKNFLREALSMLISQTNRSRALATDMTPPMNNSYKTRATIQFGEVSLILKIIR
jgi:hypothetical protein